MTVHQEAPVEALALSDVVEAEDRVAVGSEIVPTHVRYVVAFNRRPTDDEITVVTEFLHVFDVVRGVSAEGVEVITADREDPGRQIPHLKEVVAKATDEARRRVAAREAQAKEAEERSEGLRQSLEGQLVDGMPRP